MGRNAIAKSAIDKLKDFVFLEGIAGNRTVNHFQKEEEKVKVILSLLLQYGFYCLSLLFGKFFGKAEENSQYQISLRKTLPGNYHFFSELTHSDFVQGNFLSAQQLNSPLKTKQRFFETDLQVLHQVVSLSSELSLVSHSHFNNQVSWNRSRAHVSFSLISDFLVVQNSFGNLHLQSLVLAYHFRPSANIARLLRVISFPLTHWTSLLHLKGHP
jgi:hypothetical protein